MGTTHEPDTDQLLRRAGGGDSSALELLMTRHRDRLRQMVALRMDPRLSRRFDPSDVVQDSLAEACRKLPDYLQSRPLPFYPWLRQLAWNRLVDLHRRHVQAQRRSIHRETDWQPPLSDHSEFQLAECLVANTSSPSVKLAREEAQSRVRSALKRLASNDREALVLRYLEQLSTSEAAAVLGIKEDAFVQRHVRALQRLRKLLDPPPPSDPS